jgi:hypothetical protein
VLGSWAAGIVPFGEKIVDGRIIKLDEKIFVYFPVWVEAGRKFPHLFFSMLIRIRVCFSWIELGSPKRFIAILVGVRKIQPDFECTRRVMCSCPVVASYVRCFFSNIMNQLRTHIVHFLAHYRKEAYVDLSHYASVHIVSFIRFYIAAYNCGIFPNLPCFVRNWF